jgi:signal recognition particle receptor subunit beta
MIPKSQAQVGRKFHLGNELGTLDAVEIMSAKYAHLIGIFGSTDAGKTCFLSSLYLLASGGKLPRPYQFAGSLTLQAFEDRARGLRQWPDGALPKQLVDHTILIDKRQPSLLHLAIRESNLDRRRFDLLMTDLPGEWTKDLALWSTNVASFRFLQRADGIILVVDGSVLNSDQRHIELQRLRYFTERLTTEVRVSHDTPFVILVSKADEIGMQMPSAAGQLRDYIQSLGFPAETILSAAFSRKPAEIENGTGVFEAIESILSHAAPRNSESLRADDVQQSSRTFQRFRG